MATWQRVRKIANPRGRTTTSGKRRKLSPAQIKHFGTKRQKAALKASRTRKRTATHSSASKRRVSAVQNPALVLTLGAVNPSKKRTVSNMAKRKRMASRSNPRRAVRRNPVRVAASRRRRTAMAANPVRRRRRMRNPVRGGGIRRRRVMRRTRRNPVSVFGIGGSRNLTTIVLGGLLGVAAAKFIPTLIPASISSMAGNSNIARVLLTAASAYVASLVAAKIGVGGPQFTSAVMFGGLMQTASVGLNAFLPSVGSRLALSGMGDLMPGSFTVPQNPMRQQISAPSVARVNMNGISRSFGTAF